jgi:hypothetical protein
VVEGCTDHATDLLLDHAVLSRSRGEHALLGVPKNVGHGLLMRRIDHRLSTTIGQRPGHADALGCAERQIESGHRPGDLRLGGALLGLDIEHFGVLLVAL